MKIVLGAFVALALLTSGAALAPQPEDETIAADEDGMPAPLDDVERYRLIADESACIVKKAPAANDGWSTLEVEQACDSILPGLSSVRLWKEDGDGSVVLSTDSRDRLAIFAVADGAAYESIAPSRPLMQLSLD